MKHKRVHLAIDKDGYDTVAKYARELGFPVGKYFLKAALYCVRTEADKIWREVFDLTTGKSPRKHDLAADVARAGAKAEHMPPVDDPDVENMLGG